jgi:hypothetical protein
MSQDNDPLHAIEKMAVNEDLVGDLYGFYAQEFPEHRRFWEDLVAEERKHAKILRGLRDMMEQGGDIQYNEKFSVQAIDFVMNYVQREIESVKRKKPSLLAVLSIAKDLEDSLIERSYFDVVQGGTSKLQLIFARLVQDSKMHRGIIQAMLREQQSAG